MKNKQSLEVLINQFKGAVVVEMEARWVQGQLASEIKAEYGTKGIAALMQSTGFSQRKIDSLRRTYERLPASLRRKYPKVAWTYFRNAADAAGRFPSGTPESTPEFWIKAALKNGWESDGIRAAARFHTPADSPDSLTLPDRIAWLQKRALAANHAYKQIEAAVALFNKEHAVYYGATVEVRTKPVAAKAS